MLDLEAKLEAILFLNGDLLSVKKIAGLLEVNEEEVVKTLGVLKETLTSERRGLMLFEHDGGYQLVTKPECVLIAEKMVKEDGKEEITPATLETLSLIAYLGPVAKSAIEYIRGVNSSFTIKNLLMRGLVERVPHPTRGNAFLYQPTGDFLKHLGLSSKEELPQFEKYQAMRRIFETNE